MSADPDFIPSSLVSTHISHLFTAAIIGKDIYIPPSCLKFLILGHASQQVICPRTDHVHEVGQCPGSVFNLNQWFILIHGDGDKTGLYAIENQATGKRLFSRDELYPRLGLNKDFESREDM